jgi:branched-chain amino acid transport system permease protein
MFAALDPHTLPQEVVLGLLIGSIYALIALGYTMVYGVLRLINFAHGEVFMLGAYTALFVSWGLGFGPGGTAHSSNVFNLVLMLVGSMGACAVVGVLIERFAYRPMRNQPRIASLITAIGVSLLLQYGGQLILPVSPPPNIAQVVNPLQGVITIPLLPPDGNLRSAAAKLKAPFQEADAAYQEQLKSERDQYNLSPKGLALRDAEQAAKNKYDDAVGKAEGSSVKIDIPKGQLVMVGVTAVLMVILTYLVMFTKQGRAMRAVSHDFDSAALMGVNVNSIVTFTFILGSSLAGAAAMMNATFLTGIKIDTFFGALPGVKAFVAAVLGGIGNIPGAVLGGLLMGVAEALVVWVGLPEWKDAVAFVILIVVLLLRPGGLLGSSKVEKV